MTNCFAVPHAERGDEVAIGKDFNHQMLALHLRANRNETVVGWYATAFPNSKESNRCLADTSSLIHEFYAAECDDALMDSPVHLVVDTSLVQDMIGLKGYVSSNVNLNGEHLANMFHEVRLVLKSSESERIVIDEMIRSMGGKEDEKKEENDTAPLQISLEKLLHMLETASDYVGKVVDGQLEPDDSIGSQIADTLSSIPRIRPEVFDKMFSESLQDLLMVSYLSNITKTQLAIADKLNSVLEQDK